MVEPVTPSHLAEIVLVPTPAAWASPREMGASEIVTTESEEDDQVVCLVRSRLMPSLKLPAAANCCVTPTWMLGLAGVTSMLSKSALITLTTVVP
jgi:hypothetical protein